jgi:hypothetical protein
MITVTVIMVMHITVTGNLKTEAEKCITEEDTDIRIAISTINITYLFHTGRPVSEPAFFMKFHKPPPSGWYIWDYESSVAFSSYG